MEIKLLDLNTNKLININNDKIVNINVIERKGNEVLIDLNGIILKAKIEKEIPDNFLALFQYDNNNNIIKLRILNLLKNDSEFKELNKIKLLEKIKTFLFENNIPLNDEYFQLSLKLYYNGLKLKSDLLKLLYNIYIKTKNYNFIELILNYIKSGINVDETVIDFLFNIKNLYKNILNKNKNNKLTPKLLKKILEDNNNLLLNQVKFFILNYLLKHNSNIYNVGEFNDYLFQMRNEVNNEIKSYYFELSGEDIGTNLIIIDLIKEENYSIHIYLDKNLYKKIKNNSIKNIINKLKKIIIGKNFNIEINELKNIYNFWYKINIINEIKQNIFNIDISI